MSQDLRKIFEEDRKQRFLMKEGHEDRFLEKLEEAIPDKPKSNWPVWSIAASIAVVIAVGLFTITRIDPLSDVPEVIVETVPGENQESGITMGDLSPDLKKVEQYYVGQINLELASLDISEDNKMVVDRFMEELNLLNMEYRELNKELNELGPNDQTIQALIKNLQLRLQLLNKLNTTLNNLKSSENEQLTTNTI